MSDMIDRIVEADEDGNERWLNSSSQLHRDGDLPAVIYASGTKEWFKDGLCHRDNGPAVVWFNESKEWWKNGVRENDPVIDERGNKEWFNKEGRPHRDNDLPAVEYSNGTMAWYKNGLNHRDNGLPAVEYPGGNKLWYVDGKYHRVDGPAVERVDEGNNKWYIEGKELSEKEF